MASIPFTLQLGVLNLPLPLHYVSLDENLITPAFLNLCFEFYLNEDLDPEVDCYISPKMIPEIILEKFPPTRFHIARIDPF